jgi:Mu transposase-like protein
LGYSRAGAGALVFSKEAPDVLWGMSRCLWAIGALPELMVWDREGCLHAGGGRPTESYAAFCGRLPVGWLFCEPADPQAKGCVERLQGYMETNFEPGRRFANHLDYQLQLDAWFEKANVRTHKTLRARPVDRLLEEREVMRALPESEPDLNRRWVLRVPPDPHVRFDTNDYSLDPNLVGRRVEVRVSQRELMAVALDTGELVCRHERVFAKNRTVTALEHARALRERRGQPDVEELVEERSLEVYDQLIA